MKLFKRLFCKHNFQTLQSILPDQEKDGYLVKTAVFRCNRCGKKLIRYTVYKVQE